MYAQTPESSSLHLVTLSPWCICPVLKFSSLPFLPWRVFIGILKYRLYRFSHE